jgi:hypothetical protein
VERVPSPAARAHGGTKRMKRTGRDETNEMQ